MLPAVDILDVEPAPRLCDLPDVLDVEQVAAVTRLGVNAVRDMVRAGDLARVPERFAGRRILVPRRAVEQLLDTWASS